MLQILRLSDISCQVATKKNRPLLTFITDDREQAPFEFAIPDPAKFSDGGFFSDALREGDYSVELDCRRLPIAIERKSLADYYACVGRERERFTAELMRLQDYERAFVLIESTAEGVKAGYERSQVSGLAAWKSALHWSIVYGVQFHFAGNHRMGRMICQALLEEFAWHWYLNHGQLNDKITTNSPM